MVNSLPDLIAGVRVQPLKLVRNERGRLMEVQRNDDAFFLGFGQVYITSTLPGVVKAWYRHQEQTDQIALVSGSMKLALYDTRDDSSTRGQVNEILITEADPKLVQIPIGVWHGFKAMGEEELFCIHLNSIAFKPGHPDEDRLPPNDPSIPYSW